MSVTIKIEVTLAELENICHQLSSSLACDSPGFELDQGDFAGVVAAWRDHSPRYVVLNALDDRKHYSTKWALEMRDEHDMEANLLERLAAQLGQLA